MGKINKLLATFLIGVLTISASVGLLTPVPTSAVSLWEDINMFIFVHKSLVKDSTVGILEHDCSKGEKIGESKCPDNGDRFGWTLPNVGNPTTNFPYYVFNKLITRTSSTELPTTGWYVAIKNAAGPHPELRDSGFTIKDATSNYYTFKEDFSMSKGHPANTPSMYLNAQTPKSDGGDSGGTATKDDAGRATAGADPVTQEPKYAETKCDDGVGDGTYYTNGLLAGIPCDTPITTLPQVITVVLNVMNNVLLPLVGTLFTIMIILGGITYMGSNGNEQTATKAKGILTAAIIGLLITILAYFIVSLFASVIGGGIT